MGNVYIQSMEMTYELRDCMVVKKSRGSIWSAQPPIPGAARCNPSARLMRHGLNLTDSLTATVAGFGTSNSHDIHETFERGPGDVSRQDSLAASCP
jgi:hypothetical protein